jgi:hypothetical protein
LGVKTLNLSLISILAQKSFCPQILGALKKIESSLTSLFVDSDIEFENFLIPFYFFRNLKAYAQKSGKPLAKVKTIF